MAFGQAQATKSGPGASPRKGSFPAERAAGVITKVEKVNPEAIAPAEAAVKCYGVSAAGKNDCANQAAGHACAGQSKADYNGMDFEAVKDEAACTAQDGKLEPFSGKNPAKA